MVMTLVNEVLEGGVKRNQKMVEIRKIRRMPKEKMRALCRERRFIVLFPALVKVSLENKNSS